METKTWSTFANALLKYDVVLKKDKIKLIMCDSFIDGAFIPT